MTENSRTQPDRMESISVWKIWDNPIFRRYCQTRLRLRGLSIALLITSLLAGFLFFTTRAASLIGQILACLMQSAAPSIPLLVLRGVHSLLLGTAQVSGGITAEKDEGVIDYQRLIPMTPLAKVLGYLFGLPIREYVMFCATLPFTAWAIWKGQIAVAAWLPLYVVILISALAYHLTALVTGTIAKNRRWAFLISIGLVFSLYTVVPLMSRFGFVFFKYLTIRPVLDEAMPGLLPRTAGAFVKVGQNLAPDVKFFNLNFPEAVFTIICQGVLIFIFIVMLWRKWQRHESLLLGKTWATGLFIWVQILLLGNALPLIEPGTLFPSREMSSHMNIMNSWRPEPEEAVGMSSLYGVVTLAFLFIILKIITPSFDIQVRGWRRARKEGRSSLPLLSDAASAYGWVVVMSLAGAIGWYIFTQGLMESHWFPGHDLAWSVLVFYILVMLSSSLGLQTLLEAKGGRAVVLMIILIGVMPLMIGTVLSVSNNRLIPAAAWIAGASPISSPVYASAVLMSLSELPANLARALPRAFYFWQAVFAITAVWLTFRLLIARKRIAESTVGGGASASGSKDR
ncbi:MAG: hypothetical protein HC767_01590 [Akkermansiaceae bacterium]|nr:hypothetical protein [Akkermansiaceae bacterium]